MNLVHMNNWKEESRPRKGTSHIFSPKNWKAT